MQYDFFCGKGMMAHSLESQLHDAPTSPPRYKVAIRGAPEKTQQRVPERAAPSLCMLVLSSTMLALVSQNLKKLGMHQKKEQGTSRGDVRDVCKMVIV